MRLERVDYADLSSKQKEIFNYQKIAGALADYGFNCIKLADDWQGADFLAYHKDGEQTLKVQHKARVTIDRKYLGKGLYMAFPHNGIWGSSRNLDHGYCDGFFRAPFSPSLSPMNRPYSMSTGPPLGAILLHHSL